MLHRRHFSALLPGLGLSRTALSAAAPSRLTAQVEAQLQAIETASGGRLGVHILDTATGAEYSHRPDERFPMCSTFKLLACALVLWRADRGQAVLSQRITFGPKDLVGWSPVTKTRAGSEGMTLNELCHATLTTSDNTAANLILARHGGPEGLTDFLRRTGDTVTRLDRNEPTLNHWQPGELRDTTSPRAMLHSLRRIVLGPVLKPASRGQLQRWLMANTTCDARLRAGLPADWRVGDKTGTGDAGITNDIAVVWPPGRAPLVVTTYLSQSSATDEAFDATLAQVGQLLPRIVRGVAR